MIHTVILDMDDTLCECSTFYNQKIAELSQDISERTEVPVNVCKELIWIINQVRTKLPDGYSRIGFPRSLAASSAAMDILVGRPINEEASETAYALGDSVFYEPYPLFDGAYQTLRMIRDMGVHLYIWTKGDPVVQMTKVVKNGLLELIPQNHIFIVGRKNADTFRPVLDDIDTDDLSTILVVGDNMKDDIKIPSELGVQTAWISNNYNQLDPLQKDIHPTFTINNVTQLLDILNTQNLVKSL